MAAQSEMAAKETETTGISLISPSRSSTAVFSYAEAFTGDGKEFVLVVVPLFRNSHSSALRRNFPSVAVRHLSALVLTKANKVVGSQKKLRNRLPFT